MSFGGGQSLRESIVPLGIKNTRPTEPKVARPGSTNSQMTKRN